LYWNISFFSRRRSSVKVFLDISNEKLVGFLEVYNENSVDLLNEEVSSAGNIQCIMDDGYGMYL
jgi:hypothetical protein